MFIKVARAPQNTNFYLQKLKPALAVAWLAKKDSDGSSLAELDRNGGSFFFMDLCLPFQVL